MIILYLLLKMPNFFKVFTRSKGYDHLDGEEASSKKKKKGYNQLSNESDETRFVSTADERQHELNSEFWRQKERESAIERERQLQQDRQNDKFWKDKAKNREAEFTRQNDWRKFLHKK